MAANIKMQQCCSGKGKISLHLARMLHWVTLLAAVSLVIFPDFIMTLKDVSVTIPQAVKRGSNALLVCNYDMENETLYSVKWYKGKREFYRYTPKENPAMKVFITNGLNVERNLSNQSHVVLMTVPLNISGKFTCEISVEAPSFQTAMVSGEMEIVELPEQQATVTGIQPRYRIGDLVDGNCSIKFSKPAANLTWTINGIVVPPHHIKTYQIERYEEHNLESVVSAINFMVTTQHFIKGQMKLKCTASIFNIYKEEIENIIEEDRPRIMASGRSYDINAYPYDQHSSGDGFEDHNESYLTYYSAADTRSAATPTTRPFYIELTKNWQKYWTELMAIKALQPSAATFTLSLTLSSIKRNVKRCFSQISGRFKTQIENENQMALAMEIKAKEESSKKNSGISSSKNIDETDENDAAATVESSSYLLSHNSWHLSECKSAILLIAQSAIIARGIGSIGGLSSIIALLLLLLLLPLHFGRKQRRRQQHQRESTGCQNKASATVNGAMIVATLKQHSFSTTLRKTNCTIRPWIVNDFLSLDQTYMSEDIEAMKSFYNCQCGDIRLQSISNKSSDTTLLQRKQKRELRVEQQCGEHSKNCHGALNACQRQMSLMFMSLMSSTLMMTTENVEKICNFVKRSIEARAAAVKVAKLTVFLRKDDKLLREDDKLAKDASNSASLLSVDGQVSKLAIMSAKLCANDDC